MSQIRYHVVLLWDGVAGDWLSVGTWFGTCCAPGARTRARGLVYQLFAVQPRGFVCLMFVARKETRRELVLNAIKYVTASTHRWA